MTLRAIIILLLCGLCACSGAGASAGSGSPGGSLPAAALSGLPAPAALDMLSGPASFPADFRGYGPSGSRAGILLASGRSASALVNSNIPLDPPFLSALAAVVSGKLQFGPQPVLLAWAIYKLSPPAGVDKTGLLSITASGNDSPAGLWLTVADYSLGRWSQAAKLTVGTAQADLSANGNPLSPGGFVYCALVVPASSASGLQPTLDSLHFSYNDNLPSGPTYYVATPADGGDNGNDGSQAHPWATLQYAADTAVAGDTVIVLPGDYVGFMIQASGTPGNPILFSAQAGANVTSQNENTPDGINVENWDWPPAIHDVIIEGFTVKGMPRTGIRIAGTSDAFAHDIIIRNNTCSDNQTWGVLCGHVNNLTVEGNICSGSIEQHGIYLSNSGDGDVSRWNVCFDNHGCGIQYNADLSQGGDGTMSDGTIEYNILYNNAANNGGGAAINTDGVATTVFRGNLLYNNHASGIVLYNSDGQGSQDNIVLNNTILMPANARWCINMGTSPGNRLRNNILLNADSFRGAITLDSASLSGLDSDYNIMVGRVSLDDGNPISLADWQTQYSRDLHSAEHTADELFFDAGNDDYHLKAGSPAINFGVADAQLPGLDLDKLIRPQGSAIDAGAYEFAE